MKKPLFYFVLFSSIYMNAQTTIVEEKFEKENMPLSYDYLPISNKIVIEKGPKFRKINTISSYDINGKKEILADNVDGMDPHYSTTENAIYISKYSASVFGGSFKYIVDKKETPLAKISQIKNDFNEEFGDFFFNDKYELGFSNEKNKRYIDLNKDMLFLEVTDIFTRNFKKIKLEKPKMANSVGDSYFPGFKAIIKSKDSFEIISRSISKDFKSITKHITTYNIEGNKLNEVDFNIALKDYYLFSSTNGAGFEMKKLNIGNAAMYELEVMQIFWRYFDYNQIYQDNITGDIYFSGLFVNSPKDVSKENVPLGYYIFKFDKFGKKLWESINKIDDKEDFNTKNFQEAVKSGAAKSNLEFYDNKLCFSTGTDVRKQYLHYFYLDKDNGKILNNNKITFTNSKAGSTFANIRYFILSFNEYKGLDNKVFDFDGLIAIDSNKKVADYLKNINNKNKLYFNTIFSKDGIWLIESDNEEYYKVTFFKA